MRFNGRGILTELYLSGPSVLTDCNNGNNASLDKISSRIFVTLRYRDEDPTVEKPGVVIIENYASVTIISNQRKTCTYWKIFINSYIEKSHFAKNMAKCIFSRIHEFTTTLAAFKSKTGRVAQPITDAADTIGLGFATRPLTSSYK